LSSQPTVVVTGGAGFLGAYVVRDLLAAGREVVVLDDTLVANALERVLGPRERPGLRLERGDVGDGSRLVRLCERYDADRIVHLASPLTNVIQQSPGPGLAAMCAGTANVFEAARALGMSRVVWASSSAVFGRPAAVPVANDAPRRPSSLYGSGKVLCEDLAAAYRADHGVDGIGLRLTVLYGAWRLRGWAASFGQDADPIREAVLGKPLVVSDPELRLDWLYVEDAAELVCRALEAPTPVDHVFNTSGEAATRRVFAERIAAAVPSVDLRFEPGAADATAGGGLYDDTALRTQIGYGLHRSLAEGIEAAVRAYRRAGERGTVRA
jgi:nucleoside-diphosphate-sugar epimerase